GDEHIGERYENPKRRFSIVLGFASSHGGCGGYQYASDGFRATAQAVPRGGPLELCRGPEQVTYDAGARADPRLRSLRSPDRGRGLDRSDQLAGSDPLRVLARRSR